MKSAILLLALFAAALSSCTTAYKTGQTPDDVYFSPARPQDEYVSNEKDDDQQYRRQDDDYYDDRYLRMKVRDRSRWNDLDDWYYYGNRYTYTSYNCCCNSNPWTPYTYWNNHYNPYYHNTVIINPKSPTYNRPRTFNLNAYNSTALATSNYSTPKTSTGNTSSYNGSRNTNNATSTRRNSSGTFLRSIFNKDNGSSSSSSSSSGSSSGSSSSSSSSSSSNSSSSSSSKGTNAPARRF